MLYSGLATHAVSLDDFTALQQILMAAEYDDHMEMNMNLHFPQPVCMSWFHILLWCCVVSDVFVPQWTPSCMIIAI